MSGIAKRLALGLLGALGACVALFAQHGTAFPYPQQTGLSAYYSLNRRVVPAYTGSLFQLKRSDTTTLDIGQLATGLVDRAAFNTFCGGMPANPNACSYNGVYDQTTNTNHMSLVNSGTVFTVDSQGRPTMTSISSSGHFNKATPTNTPTGTADVTVTIVGDDTLGVPDCGDFGLYHATTLPNNIQGTDFALAAWAYPSQPGWRWFGLDLEQDVRLIPYGNYNTSGSPSVGDLSKAGVYVGIASYQQSSTNVTLDFNNGERVNTSTYGVMNYGGALPAQIRLGAGGDGCPTNSIFYEGAIYSVAMTAGQRAAYSRNVQQFYGITSPLACANAPRPSSALEILGRDNVLMAWGLRRLDPAMRGPLAVITRATDHTSKVIGSATGTCDFDTATAATFLAATTGVITQTLNQIMPGVVTTNYTTVPFSDTTIAANGEGSSPTYTQNCVGSHPCIDSASSKSLLTSTSGTFATRPLSVIAVMQRPSGTFGGALSTGSFNLFLGGGGSANLALFQAHSSGGLTKAMADSAWHTVVGIVPDSTHVQLCVDGACDLSGAVTTADPTGTISLFGVNGATKVLELYIVSGAVTTGQAAAIATAAQLYWGY